MHGCIVRVPRTCLQHLFKPGFVNMAKLLNEMNPALTSVAQLVGM